MKRVPVVWHSVRCHGPFLHVDVKTHVNTYMLKFINLKRIYYTIDICNWKFPDLFLVFFLSPLTFSHLYILCSLSLLLQRDELF